MFASPGLNPAGLTFPTMLACFLPPPVFAEHRRDPQRSAVVLTFLRPMAAAPAETDGSTQYPCTRMHGAAFEAEFYPAADEPF